MRGVVSFARDTVTRVRPETVTGAHHNQDPQWDTAPELDIQGCVVQPGGSQEFIDHGDAVDILWTVRAPAGTDVTALDGVKYRGILYRVNGTPENWASPTGRLSHLVIQLLRWEG